MIFLPKNSLGKDEITFFAKGMAEKRKPVCVQRNPISS
jgi:hypothetical protein